MYTGTLESAGGVLLATSLVFMALQVKQAWKLRRATSTSILSMSDASSSGMTGALALLHHRYIQGPEPEPESESAYTPVPTDQCDQRSVLLQYVLFALPFANAFASVLGFALLHYGEAGRILRRCRGDPTPMSSVRSGPSLALLGQWVLLPALLAGSVGLGEPRRLSSSEARCTFLANFPFERCPEQGHLGTVDDLLWSNPNPNPIPIPILYPNSSEIDRVLSTVYNVVRDAWAEEAIVLPEHRNFSHLLYLREETSRVTRCTGTRCVLPRTFLGIELTVLLVLLYLAPVIGASGLLLASRYRCREALETLDRGVEDRGNEEPSDPEAARAEPLLGQARSLLYRSRIFKMNAFLAVLFWTPLLIQLLSKVVFCADVPEWSMKTGFWATVLFALVRNAVNVRLAAINASEGGKLDKPNTVRPS